MYSGSSSLETLPSYQNKTPFKKIAFLGTYTPRRCGIATFTNDLLQAVSGAAPSAELQVVAMGSPDAYPPEVKLSLPEDDPARYRRAGEQLNRSGIDLLCVQHEFGIFGGPAGSYLIPMLRELKMPVVTTFHSLLRSPDVAQRKVMDELVKRSQRLVVMAEHGAEILKEVYRADSKRIDVIPHGIPDFTFAETAPAKEELGFTGREVMLTFGLLGPGKGIEYAIRSLPEITARHPEILYVVLGATHPNLVAREGERYREGLLDLARELGVSDNLYFENRYVPMQDLKRYMAAADIYLTPYPNEAQITSGTLAQAFGAGKAVVSTPYWHAKELLGDGGGILVPSRNSAAIAVAVNALLDDPVQMNALRRRAFREGREMVWSKVGERYVKSFRDAAASAPVKTGSPWRARALPELKLDHIGRMTDGTGIFQHATFEVPNFHEGYCTDDNARAFLLAMQSGEATDSPQLWQMTSTYLAFLTAAFNESNGRFRNFMNHSRQWLEEAGSEDSHGRALWALGTGAALARRDGWRLLSAKLFSAGLPAVESFTSPRAWAFTLLGLHEYLGICPGDLQAHRLRTELVDRLIAGWDTYSSSDWPWFEGILSYDNARLPQALILSGSMLPESRALEIGLTSLDWLAGIQTAGFGHFRPIGNNGFYVQNGERSDFDQQPVEAQATVAACLAAWRVSHEQRWLTEAERAFDWFLGRNDVGLALHDSDTGGCCDGLQPDRVNANQGAESTLAFALSLAELREALASSAEFAKQIA